MGHGPTRPDRASLAFNAELLDFLISRSVAFPPDYEIAGDGVVRWRGPRPAPAWHIHAWTETTLVIIDRGRRRTILLLKPRYRAVDRSATRTSQPPDVILGRYALAWWVTELLAWLGGVLGLHRYLSPVAGGPDRRTVQRWLARARSRGLALQHAVRNVEMERSEPRPTEMLFKGGLSPPFLTRRSWLEPDRTSTLYRGLAMLIVAARARNSELTPLLAEVRGRSAQPSLHNLI